MITGDYIEKSRKTKSGKVVKDKIVKSTTGVEYAIGGRLGVGGVAKVYKALRLRDKAEFVFKEYVPKPERQIMHRAIKRNIKNLMDKPLTDSDGKTPLESFIGPLDKDSLIELPASKGFGYIMKLVDTKAFLSVPELRNGGVYPDAEILCKACGNIAHLFRRVHLTGWCYKDINEGNVYINNQTGEVRIIDCDNISVQSVKVIKGTDGYMAPEVYVTSTPDTQTDYFSMAVLFYRILVGGYPMDGKKTRDYLLSNNLSIQEAASTIYGSRALFAFDPKDRSNEIRNLVDKLNPDLYAFQTECWDLLPAEIQNGFIKTFSTGLANADRHKRATDRDWILIFEGLQKNGLVKCSCGKMNFGDSKKHGACFFCGSKLPLLKPVPPPPPPPHPPHPSELTAVVFCAKRDIEPKKIYITAKRKQQLQGAQIYPKLNENWMRIEYSKTKNMLSAVNLSNFSWTVSDTGTKTVCNPGERVVLKKDLVITVLHRQLQLTVYGIK